MWCPERPYLYTAVLQLVRLSDGCVLQVESCRFGVRQISIHEGQLCLNGMPVTIAGINHHEHDDTRGKAVTQESLYNDLYLMKQHNFNAVRASHYPHHPRCAWRAKPNILST
jgi:beta-galactosidase